MDFDNIYFQSTDIPISFLLCETYEDVQEWVISRIPEKLLFKDFLGFIDNLIETRYEILLEIKAELN